MLGYCDTTEQPPLFICVVLLSHCVFCIHYNAGCLANVTHQEYIRAAIYQTAAPDIIAIRFSDTVIRTIFITIRNSELFHCKNCENVYILTGICNFWTCSRIREKFPEKGIETLVIL